MYDVRPFSSWLALSVGRQRRQTDCRHHTDRRFLRAAITRSSAPCVQKAAFTAFESLRPDAGCHLTE
jgi:2-phosphoglycerate kinase